MTILLRRCHVGWLAMWWEPNHQMLLAGCRALDAWSDETLRETLDDAEMARRVWKAMTNAAMTLCNDSERHREALERIIAMAANADSPSHSMQGRSNAWANLGSLAVDIAREALAPALPGQERSA